MRSEPAAEREEAKVGVLPRHLAATLFPPRDEGRATERLYETRPSQHAPGHWRIYSTERDIWNLVEALDDRGERESALKAALRARFDLKEPPQAFQEKGNPYQNRKVPTRTTHLPISLPMFPSHTHLDAPIPCLPPSQVRRTFRQGRTSRTVIGTIVGWLPPDGDDFALWHVKHADGTHSRTHARTHLHTHDLSLSSLIARPFILPTPPPPPRRL